MNYVAIGIVGILAFIASVLLTSAIIPILIHRQAGQNIRGEGPEGHKSKAGTPSMGGLAIIVATIACSVIGGYVRNETLVIFAAFLAFGSIGFLDDYLKVIKKENEGLKAWQKFSMQTVIALAIAIYMGLLSGKGTGVFIPFLNETVDFGVMYFPFIVFAVLAMVNAVNLTDGLDGLAAGTTAIVGLFMAIIAVRVSAGSSAIFYAAVMGACLGFLIFNRHPAKVFMGDTGSLALGGGITVAAVVMKMEMLLPIVGVIYVFEALSVVLQVGYFKMSGGKRIFKMAPLHHHFELSGMKEVPVVLMFWGVTLLGCIVGLMGIQS